MGFGFCVAYLGVVNKSVWSLYPEPQMFTSSDAHRKVRKGQKASTHALPLFS